MTLRHVFALGALGGLFIQLALIFCASSRLSFAFARTLHFSRTSPGDPSRGVECNANDEICFPLFCFNSYVRYPLMGLGLSYFSNGSIDKLGEFLRPRVVNVNNSL